MSFNVQLFTGSILHIIIIIIIIIAIIIILGLGQHSNYILIVEPHAWISLYHRGHYDYICRLWTGQPEPFPFLPLADSRQKVHSQPGKYAYQNRPSHTRNTQTSAKHSVELKMPSTLPMANQRFWTLPLFFFHLEWIVNLWASVRTLLV